MDGFEVGVEKSNDAWLLLLMIGIDRLLLLLRGLESSDTTPLNFVDPPISIAGSKPLLILLIEDIVVANRIVMILVMIKCS